MQTLETDRLTLIPFTLELKRSVISDKTQLAEMLGVQVPDEWPGSDLAEALPFFVKTMAEDSSGTVWDGIIIHKRDRAIIGGMGFIGGPDEQGSVEIGYSIIPDYRNQGYATEMAKCLINWAFQTQGINVVIAHCLKDNVGSIKVLEKVGMRCLELEGDMLKWDRIAARGFEPLT